MESLATRIGDFLKDTAVENICLIDGLRMFCLKTAWGFYNSDENIKRIKKYSKVWKELGMNQEEKIEIINFATSLLDNLRNSYKNLNNLNPRDIDYIRFPGELFALYLNEFHRIPLEGDFYENNSG